ncbi:MAG: hypothetical protein PHX25_00975 [Candidatus Pacebacteria bacterium]|nr:hypothetical protein [Candidatus Paceibacterota bacterium]
MKIYIDKGIKGMDYESSHYFISVPVTDTESISFDNSYKGYRIIKQVLVENRSFPTDQKPTSEWDTILVEDGKFVEIEHIKWIDMDKKDWCNNEIWETVWEKPVSEELNKKLLDYAMIVKFHYKELEKFSEEMKSFEDLLSEEIFKKEF